MRNLIQLAGGVAVAGVVAAGSTALTASGVVNNVTTVYAGGKSASITVNGATLETLTFTADDPAKPDEITDITLTAKVAGNFITGTPTGTQVAIKVTAGTSSNDANLINQWLNLTWSSGTSTWTYDPGTTDHFITINSVEVAIVPA